MLCRKVHHFHYIMFDVYYNNETPSLLPPPELTTTTSYNTVTQLSNAVMTTIYK